MTNIYTNFFNPQTIPQTSALPDKNQVKNNADGYVFQISPMSQLMRFLILGTSGGTYYVKERKLTEENVDALVKFIKEDGKTVVQTVLDVSRAGRAPKNDPAIFVLALAATHGSPETKKMVYDNIHRVCRIGTHLFHFCEMVNKMRKWSGGLRRGVADFYLTKNKDQLAVQLLKYRQRDGWTHRDVLRLCHAGSNDPMINVMLRYAVGKPIDIKLTTDNPFAVIPHPLIAAFEIVQKIPNVKEAIPLIKEHKMTWEMLPTSFLTDKITWKTLLPEMPLTAMLRNITKMANLGMFTSELCDNTKTVVTKLQNNDDIKKQRVHPFQILLALKAFELLLGQPKGIKTALNEAFYASFGHVNPTGKNFMVGMDVSGSMHYETIMNTNITPAMAGTALAMLLVRTEPWVETMAFADSFIRFPLGKTDTLESVMEKSTQLGMSRTDCALPILYAIQNKLPVDVFVITTDNETYCGSIHPIEALKKYRQISGRNAKLIVIGMTSTGFSIADPSDSGCLDVCGFDAGLGDVINAFVRD